VSFANVGDVQIFLGREISEGLELAQADYLLDLATGEIQAELGQRIEASTITVALPGVWGPNLELPQRPVTAVGAVQIDGTPLAAGSWRWPSGSSYITRRSVLPLGDLEGDWDDEVGLRQGASGGPTADWGLGWGGPGRVITVSFDFGSTTVPKDLRTMCLQVVARTMMSPAGGVIQEALGGYSVTYSGASDVMLTDVERLQLRRRYGRTSGSVTVRGIS
jgi:hypothetical protein